MPIVTATEAARRFADVLDAVEHAGESFTIVRRGSVVARLVPAGRPTGAELLTFLRDHPADASFAQDVRAARSLLTVEDHWPG